MEFSKEFNGKVCRFTIPERPTVEQQLLYYSAAGGDNSFLRYWNGARALIEEWQCDALPNHKADLKEETNPSITSILLWAGIEVMKFMGSLEDIPKN